MKKMLMVAVMLFAFGGMVYASEKDAAKEMVNQAVAFVQAKGRDAAIAEFNNPKGQFVKGELYVFAYDLTATMLAHPKNPKLVGKNFIDVPDTDGKLFRKEIVELAKAKGEGWVDYKYKNPVDNKIEPKTTFIKKAGDMVICCGVYK